MYSRSMLAVLTVAWNCIPGLTRLFLEML